MRSHRLAKLNKHANLVKCTVDSHLFHRPVICIQGIVSPGPVDPWKGLGRTVNISFIIVVQTD